MENRINNSEIEILIKEVINSVGLREPVHYEYFSKYTDIKYIQKLVELIASYIGLSIKANIEFVSDQYVAGKINFETKSLTDYDANKNSKAGIVAQVEIPSYLPHYGTISLQDFPIHIKVSNNCLEDPRTFITVMSHELSHILLHSLQHINKNNEFFTDLTAMALGFSNIFFDGRKTSRTTYEYNIISTSTVTHTATYGYLSDKQFQYAWGLIDGALNNVHGLIKKLRNSIKSYGSLINKYNKELILFKKYQAYLDKNHSVKFNKDDGLKLISFHQVGYIDQYDELSIKLIKELDQFNLLLKNLENNKLYFIKNISLEIESVKKSIENFKKDSFPLKEDIKLLRRHINPLTKIKFELFE